MITILGIAISIAAVAFGVAMYRKKTKKK